jgi:hypothetical protein
MNTLDLLTDKHRQGSLVGSNDNPECSFAERACAMGEYARTALSISASRPP